MGARLVQTWLDGLLRDVAMEEARIADRRRARPTHIHLWPGVWRDYERDFPAGLATGFAYPLPMQMTFRGLRVVLDAYLLPGEFRLSAPKESE